MPFLTDTQDFAAKMIRSLHCMRHDQIHRILARKHPDVDPLKIMRQLRHVLNIRDDGQYYLWPGCEVNPERIAAVDIMFSLCRDGTPVFETQRHPCALVFFHVGREQMQSFRIYTPGPGAEAECRAIAESTHSPEGHAAVFIIQNKNQIPLLKISRPHLFAAANRGGGYDFLKA